jgi:hypothetical protein
MGEAKRRKDGSPPRHGVSADSPEVRNLLAAGEPINLHLFGFGAVQIMIGTLSEQQLMAPEHHAFQRAFETIDKIRTGEIRPWRCSVVAVIDRALGESNWDKPALAVPVCHACDSVDSEETKYRIRTALGLSPPLQEGHA